MEGTFMGVGFRNLLGITLFVILMIVLLKIVFTKHPVKGVSEVVQAI